MPRTGVIFAGILMLLLILSYAAVDREFYNVSPLDPNLDLAPGVLPGMYLWGTVVTNETSFTGYELVLAPHAPSNHSIGEGESLHGPLRRVDSENEACEVSTLPDLAGSIALIKRGQCSLYAKLVNAQRRGALAVVFNGGDLVSALKGIPNERDVVADGLVTIPAMITSPTAFQQMTQLEGHDASMWTLLPGLDFALARLVLLLFVRPLIMLCILLIVLVASIRGKHQHRRAPPETIARLPTRRFNSEVNRWQQQSCTICLENFEPDSELMLLPCGHEFHRNCIAQWLLTRRGACPLCWRDIPDEQTLLLA